MICFYRYGNICQRVQNNPNWLQVDDVEILACRSSVCTYTFERKNGKIVPVSEGANVITVGCWGERS